MSFDHLAPFYQAMETIAAGQKLQRCRIAFLAEIPAPQRVLLAGEGHGRFLPECLRQFPKAKIIVADSSLQMLKIAQAKVTSAQVEFIHIDLLKWTEPTYKFDLIVTNFFLDCFSKDELVAVITHLSELATPTAEWLIADFEIATTRFARLRCQIIIALLYRFFRRVCGLRARALISPNPELQRVGFMLHRRVTYDWGLLKSEWWRRG